MTKKEITLKALEYEKINADIKKLTTLKSALNEEIKTGLQELGTTTPQGHIIFETTYADKAVVIKNTCRVSSSLVADAEDILRRSKKPQYLEEVVIVRTDKLEADIQAGRIKEDLAEKLYTTKETFALTISVKDEVKS